MATLRGTIVRCLAVSLASVASALAGTIHVPADAPTIQQGIALAANGDTVLVAPGTYHETIDFLGKRLIVQSVAGSDATTIDADDKGSVVTAASGEPAGTELRGFTLADGSGTLVQIGGGTPYRVGGGVLVDNGSKLAVRDCHVTNNHVNLLPDLSLGGGVFARQSQASFTSCRITANGAAFGAAVYDVDGSAVLDHCDIASNSTASSNSAAVQNVAQATDCVVRNNVGSGFTGSGAERCAFLDNTGFGLTVPGGGGTISQCTFAGNGIDGLVLPAGGSGAVDWTVTSCLFYGDDGIRANGFVIAAGMHTLRLVNCTFDGGEIGFDTSFQPAQLLVTNCILRGVDDAVTSGTLKVVTYSDSDLWWPATNSIDADPLWVDPANGDYRLQAGSPCINTGSPLSPLDPDGSPADMGAFPYDPWTDLGGGIAGSAGLPALEGTGSLMPGSSLTLSLSGAPAFQSTLLVVGVSQLGAPFKGGTLWPAADIVAAIAAGAGGSWTLPTTWPAGLPSAFSIWLQVWFPDAGAVQGFAASGGLKATTP